MTPLENDYINSEVLISNKRTGDHEKLVGTGFTRNVHHPQRSNCIETQVKTVQDDLVKEKMVQDDIRKSFSFTSISTT